jgi:NADP-dependent aldehyde dehydrogenase
MKGAGLDRFMNELSTQIVSMQPGKMLHAGIAKAYQENKELALKQKGITVLVTASGEASSNVGIPTIATVGGEVFLNNKLLHQEVFGPYALVVECSDEEEMLEIAEGMEGQLTATVMATDNDVLLNESLIDAIAEKCGRMILNGVPTGVEVCLSMHHGGPFPSTTDSRFTSVGADAIKRFARPMSFQNFANHLLPVELQNDNPLQIMRTLNDVLGNGIV